MSRIRTDNVFGTLTDNPMTNVAATMNSAGLANLAAVTAPDEAIIILDPNRVNGAPEIVVVTAHTGSATSATIQRGQFGTAAREHPQGTEWVHGPIASNATSFATAANDQGDYVPMGAWETWTPTVTQSGSVTITIDRARYVRLGRLIVLDMDVNVTGSGTASNIVVVGGLPVTGAFAGGLPCGSALLFDSSSGDLHTGLPFLNTTTTIQMLATRVSGQLGSAQFTAGLASGDSVRLTATYEAAS